MRKNNVQGYYINEQFEKIRFNCSLNEEKGYFITKNRLGTIKDVMIGSNSYFTLEICKCSTGWKYDIEINDPHEMFFTLKSLLTHIGYNEKTEKLEIISNNLTNEEKRNLVIYLQITDTKE